jgi:hypothetical protein
MKHLRHASEILATYMYKKNWWNIRDRR